MLHVLVVAGALLRSSGAAAPAPPVYRVDLVAAPPGPRAVGEVAPAPAAAPATPPKPAPVTPPPRAEAKPNAMPLPNATRQKLAPAATPVPPTAAKHGEGGVYLRADRDVPYGLVMRVLAVMQTNGAPNVGLVAEPEEGGA